MATLARRAFVLALCAGAARLTAAFGHEGHPHAAPLILLGARRSRDGKLIELDLELSNGFGVAATLRGVTVSIAEKVAISRRKELLGAEIWQPVRLIRLEPDETLALARPDYSVMAQGVEAPLDEPVTFEVTANFGPLGEFTVYTVAQPTPPEAFGRPEADADSQTSE